MVAYKQRCGVCKKNFVLITRRTHFVVCYECQKKEMSGEIKDSKMKKMFNIPEDFYQKNSFLRDIKVNYLRYENLSEKQIAAFKKTVKEMKENLKKSKP